MLFSSGSLLGLTSGLGLLLIWHGRHAPRAGRAMVTRSWYRRRSELLAEAGLAGLRPVHLLVGQVSVAMLVAFLVAGIGRSASVAGCFGVFAFAAPGMAVRRLRRRRMVDLREVWPDAVDNLASGIRAGLSLAEAVTALGDRGPEPLRPAFQQFGADYRATGRLSECLDRLKHTLADPVADRVCETLRMAREVGGTDVGTILRTLSTFLREDARVRDELETRQSWTIHAARLAVAAPWLILLLLASQATSLQSYDSPGGTTLLIIGGLISVLAYRLMLRIGRLPEERRVLR